MDSTIIIVTFTVTVPITDVFGMNRSVTSEVPDDGC